MNARYRCSGCGNVFWVTTADPPRLPGWRCLLALVAARLDLLDELIEWADEVARGDAGGA